MPTFGNKKLWIGAAFGFGVLIAGVYAIWKFAGNSGEDLPRPASSVSSIEGSAESGGPGEAKRKLADRYLGYSPVAIATSMKPSLPWDRATDRIQRPSRGMANETPEAGEAGSSAESLAVAEVADGPGGTATDESSTAARDFRDYADVPFSTLSGFAYPASASTGERETPIPPEVRELDGAEVVLRGLMVPTQFEGANLKSFVLLQSSLSASFGVEPMPNEWILVELRTPRNIRTESDTTATVYGTLEVGEKTLDNGALSLYRLKADRVDVP